MRLTKLFLLVFLGFAAVTVYAEEAFFFAEHGFFESGTVSREISVIKTPWSGVQLINIELKSQEDRAEARFFYSAFTRQF